jgi:glutathione synthase/RimK-type ligase-like ATP-grasp enzyme
MRIALATAAHLPHCSEDDHVLITALRADGHTAEPVVWDAPTTWDAYDVVVIRSVWDYHLKYQRFLDWLDQLDRARMRVINSTDVLRWNADKHYMLDLEQRGVHITPTRAVTRRDDDVTLESTLDETGWRHAVIKPTVSSTGYETWFVRSPLSEETEAQFRKQRRSMDVLVQEFAEGVRDGEISFVFLAGVYSHAVLKRAAGSEFRIHVEHGGTVELYVPRPAEVEWAESVMQQVTEPWSYARVDAVRDGDGMLLMELELLDPELFFAYEPASAQLMIAAITT